MFVEFDVEMFNRESKISSINGTIFNTDHINTIYRSGDPETCIMKYWDGRDALTITLHHKYSDVLDVLQR